MDGGTATAGLAAPCAAVPVAALAGVPAGATPSVLPLPAGTAAGAGAVSRWRVLVTAANLDVGDLYVPCAFVTLHGDRGLDVMGGKVVAFGASMGSESRDSFLSRIGLATTSGSGGDARVLPVYFRPGDGNRERPWVDFCGAVSESAMSDFGVSGPRSALWCICFLQRQQMHPEDYHRHFRTRHKVSNTDWGIPQHSLAMRALAVGGCSDQLDIVNNVSFELLLREAQMVEFHYQTLERDAQEKLRKNAKGGAAAQGPSIEEVALFQGAGKTQFESMVCPDLMEHIAKQLERDANILKQSRKAREERALLRQ